MAMFPKPHSRRDLTKFRDGRRKHTPQVDDRGEHRQVTTPAGAFNPNDRTRLGEHQDAHGYTGGVAPKPKAHGPAPVHGGMFHTDDAGQHAQGVSRTASASALQSFAEEQDPRSPLSGASKVSAPVKIAYGMQSRVPGNDDSTLRKLGEAVMAEARAGKR